MRVASFRIYVLVLVVACSVPSVELCFEVVGLCEQLATLSHLGNCELWSL
jgi:hypothetical protein